MFLREGRQWGMLHLLFHILCCLVSFLYNLVFSEVINGRLYEIFEYEYVCILLL